MFLLNFDGNWLRNRDQVRLLNKGLRGIEKESLRIDPKGGLSMKPHPLELGSALSNPYITTDYSEALLEFVTPPYNSNSDMLQFLCDMHTFFYSVCDDELLWSQSMPCEISYASNLPIANYGISNKGLMKSFYRNGLGYRYGKEMQLISGLHFNYSLPLDFWPAYKEYKRSSLSLRDFASQEYMSLIRNFYRISWLFIYLFGASPIMCRSYDQKGSSGLKEHGSNSLYGEFSTSLRMSDIGYSNNGQTELDISFNSLDQYIEDLSTAIRTPNPVYKKIGLKDQKQYKQLNTNNLQIENEYYSFVRPKAISFNDEPLIANLRNEGVGFIELRTSDINMMDPLGINNAQLHFTEAALIYCLLSDSPHVSPNEQKEIDNRNLVVSKEGRSPDLELLINGKLDSLKRVGILILENILEVAKHLDSNRKNNDYSESVESQMKSIHWPEETPSAKILSEIQKERISFSEFSLHISKRHSSYFKSLSLSEEKSKFFKKEAENSIENSKELERESSCSFDNYLKNYYRNI
jgi:glutamate--cysteine ligase|tara:strand:+ start:61283 stop:62848 length:1566 start_codon:yes stop_codon:yes gene_type:complete